MDRIKTMKHVKTNSISNIQLAFSKSLPHSPVSSKESKTSDQLEINKLSLSAFASLKLEPASDLG